MGKATKLLSIILTQPSMLEWEEVQLLSQQGHTLSVLEGQEADLIVGPNCWMMTEELRKYLPLAVKAARERVYGKKGVTCDVTAEAIEEPKDGGEGGGVVEGEAGGGVEGD